MSTIKVRNISSVSNTTPTIVLDDLGNATFSGTVSVKDLHFMETTSNNIFFGVNSGTSITSGYWSVGIGSNALQSQTSGWSNIAIGTNALRNSATSNSNIAIGTSALLNLTTAKQNIAIGELCLSSLSTEMAAGVEKQYDFGLVGIGYGALQQASVNCYGATAVGHQALQNSLNGRWNTAVGWQALQNNIQGTSNMAFGALALKQCATGNGNIAMGGSSLREHIYGDCNVALGDSTLCVGITGARNVAVGHTALHSANNVSDSVAIGYAALYHLDGWSEPGTNAGENPWNLAIGSFSMAHSKRSYSTHAIGAYALEHMRNGAINIAIGGSSARWSNNAINNVVVGDSSMYKANNSYGNVLVGNFSMMTGDGNSDNIAIGHSSLGSQPNRLTPPPGDYGEGIIQRTFQLRNNIAIGSYSLGNTTVGVQNVCVGHGAGTNMTTSNNCLTLGFASGTSLSPLTVTTQSNKIVMGNSSHDAAYVNVSWTVTSDVRDKDVKEKEVPGLQFVKQINPITFQYKNRETNEITSDITRYGVSAQNILEIEGVDSIIVDSTVPEKLKVTETMLIPVLINAVKELSAEIELLKTQLSANTAS